MQNHSVDWLIGGLVTFVAGTAVTLLLGQSVQKAVIAGIATAGSGVGMAALQGSRIRSSQEKEIYALQAKQNSLQEKIEEKAAAIRLIGQLEELQQKVDWQRGEEEKLEEEVRQSRLHLSQSQGEFAELQKRGELVRAEQQEITGRIGAENRLLATVTANLLPKQAELSQLTAQLSQLEQKCRQLQEQSTRLEFERSTFDALLQERDRLESKVQQLKPEKQHLEEELQRLLREIRDNVPEHNRISELRQEINALEQQRRGLRRESGALEGRIAQMIDEQTSLEAKVRELNEKLKGLEGDSQRLVEFTLQALKEPLWKAQELATTQLSFADEEGFIRRAISFWTVCKRWV